MHTSWLQSAASVPDWLTRQMDVRGGEVALETESVRWTYRELGERAGQAAGVLASFGVAPGDRVALVAQRPEVVALAVHAAVQRGAILVPVNWRLSAREIAWQLEDAGISLLICDDAQRALASAVAEQGPGTWPVWDVSQPWPDASAVFRDRIELDAVQAILYTSGTTGHPKGAMITYGNFLASALASALQLGVLPGDRWLVPMPLFHVGGLSVLMRSLIYGTTAVAHERFSAEAVNRAIDEEGITLVSVVPTMLSRMLAGRGTPYPERLRCVLLGGSYAPKPLLERCQALRVPVAQSYGLTEATSQVCTLLPQDGLRKLGSSGKPLLPTEIRVVCEGRPAAPGEPGEIIVRGPTVTPGYWRRPDATANAIQDGWLYTGDIGFLDEEGYLYVLDRRTDLIVSGGENIYPAEVENAIAAHPGVLEAAVVGETDPEWGQVPVAFVVPVRPGAVDEANLRAHLEGRLARYKVPKRFVWMEQLPRNASGKLLRRSLREWLVSSTSR